MLSWLKLIPQWLQIFVSITGFITIVSTASVKIYKFTNKDKTNTEILNYLQHEDTITRNYRATSLLRLQLLSDSVHIAIKNITALTSSLATYIQDNNPETFARYFSNIEFQIIQPVTPFRPGTIKAIPLNK